MKLFAKKYVRLRFGHIKQECLQLNSQKLNRKYRVHGSNLDRVLFSKFLYTALTVLLGYFDHVNYNCLVFCITIW